MALLILASVGKIQILYEWVNTLYAYLLTQFGPKILVVHIGSVSVVTSIYTDIKLDPDITDMDFTPVWLHGTNWDWSRSILVQIKASFGLLPTLLQRCSYCQLKGQLNLSLHWNARKSQWKCVASTDTNGSYMYLCHSVQVDFYCREFSAHKTSQIVNLSDSGPLFLHRTSATCTVAVAVQDHFTQAIHPVWKEVKINYPLTGSGGYSVLGLSD